MVRNFRGQVKISDVQEEFDNLVNSINASIDEYNANLEKTENLDYSKGSATLGGSGYCLTIGGLKTLLNNYAGTMLGAKPFKTKDGAKTLVTAGIYIDTDGCKTNRGQLIDKLGKHLYFDKTTNSYNISDDANTPSVSGYIQSDIPYQEGNSGGWYDIDCYFDGDIENIFKIIKSNSSEGASFNLSKYDSSLTLNSCSLLFDDTKTKYNHLSSKATVTVILNDLSYINQYTNHISGFSLGMSIAVSDDLGDVSRTTRTIDIPYDNIIAFSDYETSMGSAHIYNIEENKVGLDIELDFFNNEVTTDEGLVDISLECGFKPISSGGDMPLNGTSVTILNWSCPNFILIEGEILPSGVCDMNPNRTYPYIKTFHNTELVNLRTNKITTESRNLTNGNTSGGDITYDTYSPTDNKDAGIFVSYNARKSNANRPTGALFSIAGVVSNVELGTRFTHGSSTSACYRYPKFFFLPKGVTTPFSTTAADNIVRYNKYVATISQKV